MSKVMVTLQDLGILAATAERNGTQGAFVEVALQWAGEANATIACLTAERDAAQKDTASLLRLVVDLRYALGDDGRRMQPELVEYAKQIRTDLAAARADAERYRWLRAQHWDEAPLAVVAHAKQAVKPGHDCPSLERLDAAIDSARKAPATPTGSGS